MSGSLCFSPSVAKTRLFSVHLSSSLCVYLNYVSSYNPSHLRDHCVHLSVRPPPHSFVREPPGPVSVCSAAAGHKSLEGRLVDKLLANYSSDGRPVSNASEAVSVSIGMYLSKLLDLVSMSACISSLYCTLGTDASQILQVAFRNESPGPEEHKTSVGSTDWGL